MLAQMVPDAEWMVKKMYFTLNQLLTLILAFSTKISSYIFFFENMFSYIVTKASVKCITLILTRNANTVLIDVSMFEVCLTKQEETHSLRCKTPKYLFVTPCDTLRQLFRMI